MKIKASDHLKSDKEFVAWLKANPGLVDCLELRQVDGSLTDWRGTFARLRNGQRYMHGNKVATEERHIVTTPAQTRWLS